MVNAKSGVPRGYQAVMPYLRVRDAASAIKFYKKIFGAAERYRLKMGGKIGHAELDVGGCTLMLSDEFPEMNILGPKALKGTSVLLTVYVTNVDQVVAKAVKAGARVHRPAADQFYGDRAAQIEDPFGHIWSIQSRIEKVSPKDMQKRLNTLLKAEASAAIARRASGRPAKGGRTGAAPTAKPAAAGAAAAKKTAAPAKRQAAPANKPAKREAAAGQAAAAKKGPGRRSATAKAPAQTAGRAGRPKKAATA